MTKFDQLVDPLILETRKGQEEQTTIQLWEMKKDLLLMDHFIKNNDEIPINEVVQSFFPGQGEAIVRGQRLAFAALRGNHSDLGKASVTLVYFVFFMVLLGRYEKTTDMNFDLDVNQMVRILQFVANDAAKKTDSTLPIHIKKLTKHVSDLLQQVFPKKLVKISDKEIERELLRFINPLLGTSKSAMVQSLVSRRKERKISPFTIAPPDDPPPVNRNLDRLNPGDFDALGTPDEVPF